MVKPHVNRILLKHYKIFFEYEATSRLAMMSSPRRLLVVRNSNLDFHGDWVSTGRAMNSTNLFLGVSVVC